jgi:hypothetical protein
MQKLTKFRIWTMTEFGRGCFDIKAKSFDDAFARIGKKDKIRCTSIEDLETNEVLLIEEILNILRIKVIAQYIKLKIAKAL